MKKSIILLTALSAFALIAYACVPTPTGSVCQENGGAVSGTAGTRLYYPCNISSPTGATTMTSGFTGTLSAVTWMSTRLAEKGYVVLAFTPANTFGMVSGWRTAHKNCIAKLQQLNSSHAKLKGKIDMGKLSTCGHSKGGGGSLWASSELRGTLKTTVGMAPWHEEFALNTLSNITAATLIQAGATDSLATGSMTRSEYNALGNISKAYFAYAGLGHMAWASATGSRADMLADGVGAWMKYYMDGDSSYKSQIASGQGKSVNIWVQ